MPVAWSRSIIRTNSDRVKSGMPLSSIESVNQGKPLFVLHAASACFRPPPLAKWDDPTRDHGDFFRMIGGYVLRHEPFGPFDVRVVDSRTSNRHIGHALHD